MSDDTLPPVGATVEVVTSTGMVLSWRLQELSLPTRRVWRCLIETAEPMLHVTLTALWRMQQERDGLKAEVARLSRREDNIVGLLTYVRMEVERATGVQHDEPSDVVDTVRNLLADAESSRAELAAFRALAVEAKRQAHREIYPGSGMCRECGVHDRWPCLTSRLAARAPKEASDAR